MASPTFPDPLKPERNGSPFHYASTDDDPEEGYYEGLMNEEKLIKALLECLREPTPANRVLLDFYYKDYKSNSYRSYQVTRNIGGYMDGSASIDRVTYTEQELIDVPILVHDGLRDVPLTGTSTRVNMKMNANVAASPKYRVEIKLDETYAEYFTLFDFVAGTPKNSSDEVNATNVLDESFDVASTQPGAILAIEFKTQNADEFLLLNDKLDTHFKKMQAYVNDKFEDVRKTLNTSSIDLSDSERLKIYNFFTQAPMFYLSTLSPKDLYDGLFHVLLYDIGTIFYDYSDAIIKLLTASIGVEGGTKYLYEQFHLSGYQAKQIYYNLDYSEKSGMHGGQEVARKSIFASLLWLIADDNNQWRDYPSHDKQHIVFDITGQSYVDSNIAFSDEYEDKFDLTQYTHYTKQVTENLGGFMDGSASIDYHTYNKSFWRVEETQYLHPLDMVTLLIEGPDGKTQKLIVPAIFVKDLAHHREWGEVMAIIRAVVNILIIVVSLVTLIFGNPGPLLLAISIIDLGLATTDLAVQAFADEIRKLEGGQAFLDTWESVYAIAGIATALPLLGTLLRGGAKLLLKAMSAEARAQLVVMLKYALQGIKNFPKFVKGEFLIVLDFVTELGTSVASNMQKLAQEGVYLLKGVEEGSAGSKYYLGFMDNIFSSGKLDVIKKEIDYILKRGRNGLRDYIDKVLVSKFARKINTGGLRGEIPLTELQKSEIISYAKQYGIDPSDVLFKEGDVMETSYANLFGKDMLYINTDVMPGLNPITANSRVSWKGALAHELEGHRAAALAEKTKTADDLLEEVQASMRASIHGKDLTALEREILKQDAIERLAKHRPNTKLEDIMDQLWLDKY